MHEMNSSVITELKDIDTTDGYFRTGRSAPGDELVRSVRDHGILRPPLLMRKEKGGYRIIDGFNRIQAARIAGKESIPAIIIDTMSAPEFINIILLKIYHGELGPVGRVRALEIMKDHFNLSGEDYIHFAVTGLGIPREFISEGFDTGIMHILPQVMLDYFEDRDIAFKIIRNYIKLPEQAREIMAGWVEHVQLRVNVFKRAIEMVQDICRRDTSLESLERIMPWRIEEPRLAEQYILDELHRIRYPEYTALKAEAEALAAVVLVSGLEIKMPEFFEGNSLSVVVKIARNESYDELKRKILGLDRNAFNRLLGLLE